MFRTPKTSPLIALAQAQVGYTALGNKKTVYGAATGYDNQAWSGSFLDVLFSDAGLIAPALVYPPSALAEYARQDRIYKNPRPGDIVFFAFSQDATNGQLATPHVGLVMDTSAWRVARAFKTIEGQTATGNPKGSQDLNGVYERVRFSTDVIAFARPNLRAQKTEPSTLTDFMRVVRPSHFNGKNREEVALVQRALAREVDLQLAVEGQWDAQTRSAFAAWQRKIGYVNADGQPDYVSLAALGHATNLFTAAP